MGYIASSAVIKIIIQNYMPGEKADKHPDNYPDVVPTIAWPAVH